MSPVRRLLLALAGPTLLLAATACSESAGPTQAQYVSVADGVCEGIDDELKELYETHAEEIWTAETTGESNINVDRPEHWVRAKVVPKYESLSNRLKGIPPPEGDGAYLSDLYSDLDQRIEVLHRRPGDGRAVIDGDAQLRDRFESYGMEQCPPPPVEADAAAGEGAEGEGQ